ncbi:PhoPQ-activated pathogenicity-related family protein [Novipirellula artificiosorum]|uniref:PhoPQ-activated pathogenicity-related protein n=1 Tax=Novipirellula artificiosorum TaxID=2528016 RepID=A0A5C6E1E0_9BACT|nr:PhoPQ-activated pathogenicity-related family protein [Novipirellula artificiosorum]TWU42294.1 PhoPQ-activated pathogenicity-related protein [Novipirellula artificiosorum]
MKILSTTNVLRSVICLLAAVSTCPAQDTSVGILPLRVESTPINDGPTALDEYVAAPDDTYQWQLVASKRVDGFRYHVIDLKSQTWLTPAEVDRPVWQHWLTLIIPDAATSETAMMMIDGGSNGKAAPEKWNPLAAQVALATRSIVATVSMIPNQPLEFSGDGQRRYEDDLIGYTWDKYMKTDDARWPARLPMTKAVVRAMDTVEAFTAQDNIDGPAVTSFVVTGASKRGWTTWTTAAVDDRVKAIAPIVIDVLNVSKSMDHHFAAYGFWAPAIGNYVQHKITDRFFDPQCKALLQLVDPFAYRDRLTMPKLILNAAGDQFFLPDSSQCYFDELLGEKHLCYVPNGDHSLGGTNALESLIAFHYAILNEIDRPDLAWESLNASSTRIEPTMKPSQVTLWQATNPNARDFRVETIGRSYLASEIQPSADGSYLAEVEVPEQGFTAFLVQFEFDIGAPTPLRLTTPVRVIPDTLPFADHLERRARVDQPRQTDS